MRKVTSLQRVLLLIAVSLLVVGATSIGKRDKRYAGTTGQWTSDNGYKYGTTYGNNQIMKKVIDTGAYDPGSPYQECVVTINYETDIEPSFHCTFDRLILNARGTNKTIVCGKTKAQKKITVPKGQPVILKFSSDTVVARQGFQLDYEVSCPDIEVPIGRTVGGIKASGHFENPENGSPEYEPNLDLTYRYLTTGSTIYIEYEVDIEADERGSCPFDYLLIYTVSEDIKLCGHKNGNMTINVENNQLVALFHTDRAGNDKGFKVDYKVVDSSSSLPRGSYARQGWRYGRSGPHFRGSAHKRAYYPHEQFLPDQIENSNSFFSSGQNQNPRTNDFPLPYDWNQGSADNRVPNGQIDDTYPAPLLEENQNLGANFPSLYDQVQRTDTNRLPYDLIKKLNAYLGTDEKEAVTSKPSPFEPIKYIRVFRPTDEKQATTNDSPSYDLIDRINVFYPTDEKQATIDNRLPYDPRPYNRNQGFADNRFPNRYPSPSEDNLKSGANYPFPHDQIQSNGINPLPYKLIEELNAYLETDEKEAVTRKPLPYGLLKKLNAYLETDEKQATTNDLSYDLIDRINVFYPSDEKQATTDNPSYDLIDRINVFYPADEKQTTTGNHWPYDPRPYNRNQGFAANRFPNRYPSPSEDNQNSGANYPFPHDQIQSNGINPLLYKLIQKLNAYLKTDEKEVVTSKPSPYNPIKNIRVFFPKDEK